MWAKMTVSADRKDKGQREFVTDFCQNLYVILFNISNMLDISIRNVITLTKIISHDYFRQLVYTEMVLRVEIFEEVMHITISNFCKSKIVVKIYLSNG